MRKLLLMAGVLLAIGFVPASAYAQVVVGVNGMVCDFCAQALNKVFLREDAVDRIDVSLDDKTVTIHYKDGAEPLSEEIIGTLIYEAGYNMDGIRGVDAP